LRQLSTDLRIVGWIMERNDKVGVEINEEKPTWISAELISEFKEQQSSTEYDQNGCDVTLQAVNGDCFLA